MTEEKDVKTQIQKMKEQLYLLEASTSQSSEMKDKNDSPSVAEDLSDLPEELRKELNLNKRGSSNSLSAQIRSVIEAAEAEIDINTILIGIYRKYKRIVKRHYLSTQLYTMKNKKEIFSVPGKKGIYSKNPK